MGADTDLVGKAYAAFARGDIPAILELLDDGVEWSSPATLPQGGTFQGEDGVLAFFQGVGAAWDALEIQVESLGDGGDGVVLGVVRGTGTLKGGRAASYGAAHVFNIKGGKIARFREYVDVDGPLVG